jgi:CHAT domain-containing protein/Tfp pilus assembly protein PilF
VNLMKLSSVPLSIGCILALVCFPFARLSLQRSDPPMQFPPGVVVEKVARNSEAEKAGMRPGDILLRWERDDHTEGEVESPFDLALLEIESQRGNVKLEGLRDSKERSWNLGRDVWGIEARPNLQEKLLDTYQKGQELSATGKFSEAAGRWQSAAAEAGQRWMGPWLLFHTATILEKGGLFKEADGAYRQVAQMSESVDARVAAQVYRTWADSFQKRNDWANAKKYYQQAGMEDERSGKVSLPFALDLCDLGSVAHKRGSLAEAAQYYRQALDVQEKLAPESGAVATSISGLAGVAWSRGDVAEAEQYFHRALEIRKKLTPTSLDVASSLTGLGLVAWRKGDLAKAEEYHQQALEIGQKLAPTSMAVAKTLNNLGITAWSRGDLAKAEQYHLHALHIKQQLGPGSLDEATSLESLGIVVGSRGDLGRAEDYFLQSLRIRKKLSPDSVTVATALNNLGMVAWDREDVGKAREYFRSAWEIQQRLTPGSIDSANSLINLGDTAKAQGDLAQAEENYNQALKIAEKTSPEGRQMAQLLRGFGDLAHERHDLAKAELYDRQAVGLWERLAPGSKDHAEALAALAAILRDQQQADAAADLYEQALKALDSQITRLGGVDDARSDFRARHISYYKDYIDLLIHQKRPEEAFSLLERSRARALLEMLVTAHINIRNGVEPGLLARERSLQADIAAKSSRRIALFNAKPKEQQIVVLEKEIADLLAQNQEVEERIRSSSPVYAALTQPPMLTIHDVQQQFLDKNTLLLEYSLSDDRSFVFAVTPDSLDVFTLPKRAEIERVARILYGILTARNKVVQGETDVQAEQRWKNADSEYRKIADDLSNMILGPVATLMENKRLLIVSDGALQYIPFAALPVPEKTNDPDSERPATNSPQARATKQTNKPLVVEHEIVNLPSASVVAELRRAELARRPPVKEVAVLADPVFDPKDRRVTTSVGRQDHRRTSRAQVADISFHESSLARAQLTRSASEMGFSENGIVHLGRLEYTRQEAKSILALTPHGRGMAALDFEASKETAMSPALAEYRVVHLATHGILNSRHPELSGLVFSLVDKHGAPRDGFLDLEDIYNLNLPVDMTVLSGCETGLGKEIRDEGLIGLTRGFMYAGSSRVMASLWSVSDQATAELMAAFYKAMERDKKSPAAALRAAQIEVWKQDVWRSPYYWAAFEIQGEWK